MYSVKHISNLSILLVPNNFIVWCYRLLQIVTAKLAARPQLSFSADNGIISGANELPEGGGVLKNIGLK